MKRAGVLEVIQSAFDALRQADLVESDVRVDDATVLLGPATLLDSIAFVTFMVEVEDRLQAENTADGAPISLAINEIHAFNPDKSRLTVGVLADFIVRDKSSPGARGG